MPILIKNVQGELYDQPIGDIIYVSNVTGEIQSEDYINMNGLIAYLQNFTKIETTQELSKPFGFGLKNTYNITIVTLEIDY